MRLRGNLKHSRNSRRIRINVPPSCHSDRSASGVEESTTWQKVPTQGKICNLRRFLGSLRSLGMTCRGAVPFTGTGCIRYGASPWRGWSGDESSPLHLVSYIGSYHLTEQVVIDTWRAADCRWNYGVIAPGNQLILIRCAKHHPYVNVPRFSYFSHVNPALDSLNIRYL